MIYTSIKQLQSLEFAKKVHKIVKFMDFKYYVDGKNYKMPSPKEIQKEIINLIEQIKKHPKYNEVKTHWQEAKSAGFTVRHKKYARHNEHNWLVDFSPISVYIQEKIK